RLGENGGHVPRESNSSVWSEVVRGSHGRQNGIIVSSSAGAGSGFLVGEKCKRWSPLTVAHHWPWIMPSKRSASFLVRPSIVIELLLLDEMRMGVSSIKFLLSRLYTSQSRESIRIPKKSAGS